MKHNIFRRPIWAIVAIFALLFGLVLASMPAPAPVQAQNTACFRAQGGALWACGDGGTMEFREGSTLKIDTALSAVPQADLTLTMNGYITPTGTFQPVRSAGAVSISGANIADGDQGDLLILFNAGGQTITITETTGLVSAGNIALGALDAATLVFSGTTWIQAGASNN